MRPIIFWGATGQAIVLEEFLQAHNYQLVALVDNNDQVESPFENVPLLTGKPAFEKWREGNTENVDFAIAIGGDKGTARIELGTYLESKGLSAASLIHPTAFVAQNATIGKGAQVLAQSAVCARVTLGDYCIINTMASIDHECRLGNGVHIGPGAKLAGCIEIGENSFIGTGAIVLPRLRIGKNVIVGAGAVVTKDVPDNVIVYGNPARVMRDKK